MLIGGCSLSAPFPPCRPQTRPNKPGEPATELLLTHRTGQVDFKLAVVRCVDGAYEYFDTMADPETTGNFRLSVDGNTLEIYATAPRKWFMRFLKEADGSWKCVSPDYPGTTAVASDITPAPSKLGAGGLPKGQVNLGEQDEDVRWGGVECAWCCSSSLLFAPSIHPLPSRPRLTTTRARSQAFNPLGF